jgi:adenylosuccinate synthase
MEYHNFMLTEYYKAEPLDYDAVLADALSVADLLKSMVVDADLARTAKAEGRAYHV